MSEMGDLLATILSCPPEELGPETALGVHPRWDSFAHLNVMLALEQRFGIEITEQSIRRYASLAALEALAEEKVGT